MYTLTIKDGKAFGKEVNPYGENKPDLLMNLTTLRQHGHFQQEVWQQAESNLKEFEIDEDENILTVRIMIDLGLPVPINQHFTATLKNNKLTDLKIV